MEEGPVLLFTGRTKRATGFYSPLALAMTTGTAHCHYYRTRHLW